MNFPGVISTFAQLTQADGEGGSRGSGRVSEVRAMLGPGSGILRSLECPTQLRPEWEDAGYTLTMDGASGIGLGGILGP